MGIGYFLRGEQNDSCSQQYGRVGISTAMEMLRNDGSAIDAVEAGIRLVESNPQDNTVGLGGIPNLLGEVELDASIMDGQTMAAGAVAALRGYEHPISIVRKIIEELPHVLLVGSGAERFAAEMGFEGRELLAEESKEVWEERLHQAMPGAVLANLKEEPALHQWVKRAGRDILSVATAGWEAGDIFAQVHHFLLPSDIPAGQYQVEIGVYSRTDM